MHSLGRLWYVALLVMATAALGLTGSYLASAYHVESAGRWMGEGTSQTGDLIRAQRHLQQAIQWDPDNAQAYRLLTKVYKEQGEWGAALEALAHYNTLRPDSPLGKLALAEYYGELEAQMADLTTADLLLALSQAEVQVPATPLEAPQSTQDPSLWRGYVGRTTFEMPPEQIERPTLLMHPPSSATYTIQLPPEPVALHFGMGLEASDGTEASATFEVLIDGEPVFGEEVDPGKSQKGWQERAVDLAPWAGQEIELTLRVEAGSSGSTSGARAGWGEPVVADPYWLSLRALASRAEMAEAWRELGMSATDLIHLGESAREAGVTDEAIIWYKRATQLQPSLRDPWYYMGLAHEAQDQWQEAIDAYNYGLDLPDSDEISRSRLYAQLGNVYQRLLEPPQLEEAQAAYQAALAEGDFGSAREAAWLQARLGQVNYAVDGNAGEAEARLRGALELAPEDPWLYIILGDFLREQGRATEAMEMYETALERDPDLAAAQVRLEALNK